MRRPHQHRTTSRVEAKTSGMDAEAVEMRVAPPGPSGGCSAMSNKFSTRPEIVLAGNLPVSTPSPVSLRLPIRSSD